MKILELRETARQALGPKVRYREFHDVDCRRRGPLSVLERVVRDGSPQNGRPPRSRKYGGSLTQRLIDAAVS